MARGWNDISGWSATVSDLGDGDNDDDKLGAVRYSIDGSRAVLAWSDESRIDVTPRMSAVTVNVWDSASSSWTGPTIAQPAGTSLHFLAQRHSVAQDAGTGAWILAYMKTPGGLPHAESSLSEVAVRVGSASPGAGWQSHLGEQLVTNDAVHDGMPVLSMRPDGAGLLAWGRRVGGQDREIVAASWNPATLSFGPVVQVTNNGVEEFVHALAPGQNGWHMIFSRQAGTPTSRELWYGWCTGSSLIRKTRLTNNHTVEGDLANGYRQIGVDAATTMDGRLFLVWEAWNGTQTQFKDVYVGEIVF